MAIPTGKYQQRLYAQLTGLRVISTYVRGQFQKGLLSSLDCNCAAHWGKCMINYDAPLLTHRDVVLPEIQRLVDQYYLRMTVVETTPVTGVPGYVLVRMRVY